ncbi:MAG: hypothetical protein JNM76_13920 [Betaproteobacteria bacterium]|nr:hypothetical protein [Betaproteobacteria bacterium]
MGIKDWFGGDKKKNEFREKVKAAVADGRLTSKKMAELEATRQALDVDDASDDRTTFRRDAYNEAVSAVKAGGKMTVDEARELARIQKFLALSDDQIEKTRWDLVRLKTFTDIREGRLPQVSATHNALRGLKLQDGEVAHYCVPAEIFSLADPGSAMGARSPAGMPYALGAGLGHELPAKAAVLQDSGVFLMTSQRMLLRADGHNHAFGIRDVDQFYFYRDGIRLRTRKGNTLIRFQSEGIVDVVGALLDHFTK